MAGEVLWRRSMPPWTEDRPEPWTLEVIADWQPRHVRIRTQHGHRGSSSEWMLEPKDLEELAGVLHAVWAGQEPPPRPPAPVYVCPQCGPDRQGEPAHSIRHHRWPPGCAAPYPWGVNRPCIEELGHAPETDHRNDYDETWSGSL